MSKTTISFKQEPFSIEKTQQFIQDLDKACHTFKSEAFIQLFQKYDWHEQEDYQEVLSSILDRFKVWNSAPKGITIFEIAPFEAHCIYCYFGKQVSGYNWKFHINGLATQFEKTIFTAKMAFIYEYENGQLVEFGICNAHTDPMKIETFKI